MAVVIILSYSPCWNEWVREMCIVCHVSVVSVVAPVLSWSLIQGSSPCPCVVKKVCMWYRVNSLSREVVTPTFPPLYLRHSSFSNRFVASPTSQLILQPFRCFTYVTVQSTTLLSLLLRHRLFTNLKFVHYLSNHCVFSLFSVYRLSDHLSIRLACLLFYIRLHLLTDVILTNVYWSVNFFRRTMHSKSAVVNLAEPSWNTFGKQMSSNMQQSIVTCI